MKGILSYIIILFIVSCSSTNNNSANNLVISEKGSLLSNVSFPINGMKCEMGCAAIIEGKVSTIDGVINSQVNFETETGFLTFDTSLVSFEVLKSAIEGLGDNYKVGNVTIIEPCNVLEKVNM